MRGSPVRVVGRTRHRTSWRWDSRPRSGCTSLPWSRLHTRRQLAGDSLQKSASGRFSAWQLEQRMFAGKESTDGADGHRFGRFDPSHLWKLRMDHPKTKRLCSIRGYSKVQEEAGATPSCLEVIDELGLLRATQLAQGLEFDAQRPVHSGICGHSASSVEPSSSLSDLEACSDRTESGP